MNRRVAVVVPLTERLRRQALEERRHRRRLLTLAGLALLGAFACFVLG